MEKKGKNGFYSLAMSHLIGLSLVVVKECLVRLPTTAFLGKFITWPIAAKGFLTLRRQLTKWYEPVVNSSSVF